jgi:preprotein translocase subunit SecB
MSAEEKKPDSEAAERKQGQFAIQKVYVKDLSFETPNSPHIFQKQWQPVVNMDLASSATVLDKANYEVVLSITVTVSVETQTVYLVEVQQAGIFHLSELPQDIAGRMLATVCPNILFPFAREVVADLVTRGGFPQLLLAPVNFDALYLQQQQQRTNGDAPIEPATRTVQ